jgi:hypothetical protein
MVLEQDAGLLEYALLAAGVEVGHHIVEWQQAGDLVHGGSNSANELQMSGACGGAQYNAIPLSLPTRSALAAAWAYSPC